MCVHYSICPTPQIAATMEHYAQDNINLRKLLEGSQQSILRGVPLPRLAQATKVPSAGGRRRGNQLKSRRTFSQGRLRPWVQPGVNIVNIFAWFQTYYWFDKLIFLFLKVLPWPLYVYTVPAPSRLNDSTLQFWQFWTAIDEFLPYSKHIYQCWICVSMLNFVDLYIT